MPDASAGRNRLGDATAEIIRLSGPLKQCYAQVRPGPRRTRARGAAALSAPRQEHGLDLEQLLGAGPYKERYRLDMIRWGEERRNEQPDLFCRLATAAATRPVWIVSDARRPSDVDYFRRHYDAACVCVRIEASDAARAARGFRFVPGIDDAPSECALDAAGVAWDRVVRNDGIGADDDAELVRALDALVALVPP